MALKLNQSKLKPKELKSKKTLMSRSLVHQNLRNWKKLQLRPRIKAAQANILQAAANHITLAAAVAITRVIHITNRRTKAAVAAKIAHVVIEDLR